MKNNVAIKEIALLSTIAGMITVIFLIPIAGSFLGVFLLIVFTLSLKLRQSILLALVVGVTSYLVKSDEIIRVINIGFFPLIALGTKLTEPIVLGYEVQDGQQCLTANGKINHYLLALFSFLFVFAASFISELLAVIFITGTEDPLLAFLISLPVSFAGALVVAILTGFLGIYFQKRICKLFMYFSI